MKLDFSPLTENDFGLMHRWLNRLHVLAWWDDAASPSEVADLYRHKLKSDVVFPYIVFLDEIPIGYIQSYDAHRVGGGWWPDMPQGVWGIDAFIGEPELLEKGHGSAMLKTFSNQLLMRSDVDRVIADPHPKNVRAVRAYGKAGFKSEGPITTPDGPALLMVKRSSDA